MAKQRPSARESGSWLTESQVFTDTQRVDLFDDPRWEMTPRPAPRRAGRRSFAPSTAWRRVLHRRGQHSRPLV